MCDLIYAAKGYVAISFYLLNGGTRVEMIPLTGLLPR
jgi:hypothetical protein